MKKWVRLTRRRISTNFNGCERETSHLRIAFIRFLRKRITFHLERVLFWSLHLFSASLFIFQSNQLGFLLTGFLYVTPSLISVSLSSHQKRPISSVIFTLLSTTLIVPHSAIFVLTFKIYQPVVALLCTL